MFPLLAQLVAPPIQPGPARLPERQNPATNNDAVQLELEEQQDEQNENDVDQQNNGQSIELGYLHTTEKNAKSSKTARYRPTPAAKTVALIDSMLSCRKMATSTPEWLQKNQRKDQTNPHSRPVG